MKRCLRVLIALLVAMAATVAIDRTVVRAIEKKAAIPRFERMVYETSEFTSIADINSDGYRDDEYPAEPQPGLTSVAVIGDSFTFGWGVQESNVWPRILEGELGRRGLHARVFNLGKPGDSPSPYAARAARMVPRLRPRIVIVAVLQGDDLAQLKDRTPAELAAWLAALQGPPPRPLRPAVSKLRAGAKAMLHALVPHTLALRSTLERTQTTPIVKIWRDQAEKLEKGFLPDARRRLHALPGDLYSMFMSGNLNPALVRLTAVDPGYFLDSWDLSSTQSVVLVNCLAQCLTHIRTTCEANDAEAIVCIVPYGMYVSERAYKSFERLGFALTPEMLKGDNADEAIRRAAQAAGLPCISLQADFRERARSAQLFYDADGHFNPAGHQLFAELLAARLAPRLSAAATSPQGPAPTRTGDAAVVPEAP